MNNVKVIKCPVCGEEYLPGEIYYPKHFIGQPKEVLRSSDGIVQEWSGTTMDTKETFTCEKCGTTFIVEAKVDFYTKVDVKKNLNSEYTTSLYSKDRVTLSEEN